MYLGHSPPLPAGVNQVQWPHILLALCTSIQRSVGVALRRSDAERKSSSQLRASMEKLEAQAREKEARLKAEKEQISELRAQNEQLQKALQDRCEAL